MTAVDEGRDDDAEFMGDVVGANGRVSRPRGRFKKSWRIRNTGTVLWRNRFLTCEGATSTGGLKTPPRVRIGETAPGGSVEVSAWITAPAQPGRTSPLGP